MEPVEIVFGTALPLNRSDVDTDQIIPSDWLKRVERTGFDRGLCARKYEQSMDKYYHCLILSVDWTNTFCVD